MPDAPDERSELHETLVTSAREEGFPLAGAIDLARAFEAGSGGIRPHMERYDRWLAAGYAGEMQYLARGRDRRADPGLVFPKARSIFCVALPYASLRPAGADRPEQGPRYARYLSGRDYHGEVAERLERVMKRASERWFKGGEGRAPLGWKVCVDTSAVLERSWAALVGLGWIGKNTMLIHPKLGSYLFLGAALIDHEVGRGPSPLPDYCGYCRRCLDACPAGAFIGERLLDSNRCISYWTLEKRGAIDLSEERKAAFGTWVAGCDACQEVCPFNRKPVREQGTRAEPDPGATRLDEWKALLLETEGEYRARVANSALKRVKPGQFRRNVALALANAFREVSPERRVEMRQELEPLVRSCAKGESDEATRVEWARCLETMMS